MPTLCAVYKCGHNNIRDKEYRFFRIPKIISHQGEQTKKLSAERRVLWLKNISRTKKDLTEKKANGTRVCSAHFVSGKPANLTDRNNIDWAPTVNMGHSKIKTPQIETARGKRATKRATKRAQNKATTSVAKVAHHEAVVQNTVSVEAVVESIPISEELPLNENNSDLLFEDSIEVHLLAENDKECQTPIQEVTETGCQTALTIGDLESQELFMRTTTMELQNLKEKLLDGDMTINGFRDNNEKTKFYTGVPSFELLMHVFNFVSVYVITTKRNALSQFQEFILVLMRIKLNMPLQDLAYRFSISSATASRIFDRWLDVLSVRLDFLIHWPDCEDLRRTMPVVFQKSFGNKVSVIIDCFEVFIDRPSSLIARAMTWSNYKHHNTIKFLIGVTPQGSVSFLSKAWGGRVSDKHITENSGILRKLEPGDIVLADRGFKIEDSVGFYQARLYIPAFTRGKKQLSGKEVEETRKIANVRIHVERIIGLVRRKYIILQSTLPIEMIKAKSGETLSPIDKIVKVCCALTNLSESIVPFD